MARGGEGVVGLSPGWLWLMLFAPIGIALSAMGLEFLEKFLVSGDRVVRGRTISRFQSRPYHRRRRRRYYSQGRL